MVKLSISFTHCSFFLFLFSFLDLIQDWASDSAPDIYSFVPYSWKFKILFHQFEMIWAANQHNWIDCSTKQQENGTKDDLPDVNNLRSRKFILNEKFPTLNKKRWIVFTQKVYLLWLKVSLKMKYIWIFFDGSYLLYTVNNDFQWVRQRCKITHKHSILQADVSFSASWISSLCLEQISVMICKHESDHKSLAHLRHTYRWFCGDVNVKKEKD